MALEFCTGSEIILVNISGTMSCEIDTYKYSIQILNEPSKLYETEKHRE